MVANRVQQYVAMFTMTLDHMAEYFGEWASVVGNVAMPIYTHAISRGRGQVLPYALLAEIPFYVATNTFGNIVWLFWIARLGDSKGNPKWLWLMEIALGMSVGLVLFTAKPIWAIWVVLATCEKRELWYGVFLVLGTIGGWQWWVHLVGYELGRWGYGKGPRINPWLWKLYYPGHLLLIGVGLRVFVYQ